MGNKGRHRYDWDFIRQEYITTDVSIKELSEKHGIRVRTVEDHCAQEGWVEQRRSFQAETAGRVAEKVAEKISDNKSDILAKVLMCADIGSDKAYELLSGGNVKATDLEHIINSLEGIERMARSIQGLLNVIQAKKLEYEERRLKIEENKAEAFNPDNEIVIRIEGANEQQAKEWSE